MQLLVGDGPSSDRVYMESKIDLLGVNFTARVHMKVVLT